MAILVTGGAGFIGSHFIEHVLEHTDSSVVCFDNFNDYYDPARKRSNVSRFFGEPRVSLVRGDFCQAEQLDSLCEKHEIDEIMHLGGYAGVRYSVENPHIYQQVNVLGTLNLLEMARRLDLRRFVLASSSTVYGRGAAAPFAEDAHLGVPLSPYGASKRAAELLSFNYLDLHGVPTVAVRLFSVFGRRLRPDLAMSLFAERMVSGRPIALFGDGSILRDFTHVSDVCRGLLAALRTPDIEGEAFNIGHDEPVAMSEVIRGLEKCLNRRANVRMMPPRHEDMPVTHAHLAKSRTLLGYRPTKSFEEGLTDFTDWYLEHHAPAAIRNAA